MTVPCAFPAQGTVALPSAVLSRRSDGRDSVVGHSDRIFCCQPRESCAEAPLPIELADGSTKGAPASFRQRSHVSVLGYEPSVETLTLGIVSEIRAMFVVLPFVQFQPCDGHGRYAKLGVRERRQSPN
jgi:hypothetical protein